MIYKPNTICVLCGTDKEDAWKECDYWVDEDYYYTDSQPHSWNKEEIDIASFKFKTPETIVLSSSHTIGKPSEGFLIMGGNLLKSE